MGNPQALISQSHRFPNAKAHSAPPSPPSSQIVLSEHGLLTTVAYKLGKGAPTTYALEGSVAIAGAAVRWLRDNLNLIKTSGDIEPLAKTVKDSGGVYFVPAFSGLFAPYWRTDARGWVDLIGIYVYHIFI